MKPSYKFKDVKSLPVSQPLIHPLALFHYYRIYGRWKIEETKCGVTDGGISFGSASGAVGRA